MHSSLKAGIVLFLLVNPLLAIAQHKAIAYDEAVLPKDTDPDIQTFNYPQAVYHPKGKQRGQLLILLTGTNGKAPLGLRLSTNAARLGFHVIQPMYPDDVPASACARDSDPDSFAKFRWAIIEGGSSPHLKNPITKAESIENRVVKLIEFLNRKYPTQNWGQYLKDGEIVWGKIVIAGMSQGGGHAALIATKYRVARVLCFGAPKDYSKALKAPAKWYDTSVTPPNHYFAFNNTHDKQACDYDQEVENLTKLGIAQVGGIANVDEDAPPYHNAHALFTSWPGPTATIESIPAHVSVIRDTLLEKNGVPLFRPVWIYMLTAPID